MGEHRNNPRAIRAAEPRPLPQVKEAFGFEFEVQIELNKEKLAEVVGLVDAARARGDDPKLAVPPYDHREHPEWFDYVVYNRAIVARPSSLVINPDQIPAAKIRLTEHTRFPLADLYARVDGAFAEREMKGTSH